MRERLLALAERRAHLQAQAQAERTTVSALLSRTDTAASLVLAAVRTARRALDEAGRHLILVAAGVALLAALRPRRALVWLGKGWSLWRLYRGVRGLWLRFAAPAPAGAPRQPW